MAEVDLAYPALRIAIEVDGNAHRLPEVQDAAARARNDLGVHGWLILYVTRERLTEQPLGIVREVRSGTDSPSGGVGSLTTPNLRRSATVKVDKRRTFGRLRPTAQQLVTAIDPHGRQTSQVC